MIECSNENIWYTKKRKKFKARRYLSFFLIIIFSLCYYNFFVVKNIKYYCESYFYTLCTSATNTTVFNCLSGVDYYSLVNVEKNNSGEITMLTANSTKINYINKKVVISITDLLSNEIEKGFSVPLLAFSGIKLISGYGKKIKLKSLSIASVTSEFDNNFTSVGINQTLHSIYIKIQSEIKVGLDLSRETIKFQSSILISETVLVGKIPDVYLNGKLFG